MTRRTDRVNFTLRRELGALIADAVSDPRLAPMTSVTRVDVSHDLEHARVYVSVLGDEEGQAQSLAALQSASGMLQRELESRMRIRRVPRLLFHLDGSLAAASDVLSLIDRVTEEDRRRAAAAEDA